jgi:catechol 1,2-dioxygenase
MLNRRSFLKYGVAGAAASGTGWLTLPTHAEPTESSGSPGEYGGYLLDQPVPETAVLPAADANARKPEPATWKPTEDNILGPYHRPGAPYRAKITPPLADGVTLIIGGHVWGLDTRKPLAGAVIDIWQADHGGRYDNDGSSPKPDSSTFLNRARVLTDEHGYYEYETIIPGRYRIGPDLWRPAHIHYLIRANGYRDLITQLYFEGDPYNDKDQFIRKSLIISPETRKAPNGQFKHGTFDIILERK